MVATLLPIVASMREDGKVVTREPHAQGTVKPRVSGARTYDAISPDDLSAKGAGRMGDDHSAPPACIAVRERVPYNLPSELLVAFPILPPFPVAAGAAVSI
jgi:hypothetical protein